MTFGTRIARTMAMTDAVWERHANPWSAWTRIPILPLICLSIWARAWIGWWCVIPIGVLVLWIWLNPRAFPRPRSTQSWASRAVLGERVWLNRAEVPIPRHHVIWAGLLAALSAMGIPPLVWGLWVYDLWATITGLVLVIGPKMWFLDRMVWLYVDMAPRHPEYAAWRR
ncbi:MAG: DUF6653 family protein [Pseudomonadota bacterium]